MNCEHSGCGILACHHPLRWLDNSAVLQCTVGLLQCCSHCYRLPYLRVELGIRYILCCTRLVELDGWLGIMLTSLLNIPECVLYCGLSVRWGLSPRIRPGIWGRTLFLAHVHARTHT